MTALLTGCAVESDVGWGTGVTTGFVLDTSEAPRLSTWGRDIVAFARQELPRIAGLLGESEFPERITIIIRGELSTAARTSGTTIQLRAAWFEAMPTDRGAIVHELTHVFQRYPGARPRWLVEGIADWVRWEQFEPEHNHYVLQPDDQFQQGYRVAAAFLDYLNAHYGDALVLDLHRCLRTGRYDRSFFENVTGRELEDLWDAYTLALRGSGRLAESAAR